MHTLRDEVPRAPGSRTRSPTRSRRGRAGRRASRPPFPSLPRRTPRSWSRAHDNRAHAAPAHRVAGRRGHGGLVLGCPRPPRRCAPRSGSRSTACFFASVMLVPLGLIRHRDEYRRLDRRAWRLALLAGGFLAAALRDVDLVADATRRWRRPPCSCRRCRSGWRSSARFIGERTSRRAWLGIGIGLAGTLVISSGGFAAGGSNALFGDALALAGALFAAIYVLLGRSLRPQISVVHVYEHRLRNRGRRAGRRDGGDGHARSSGTPPETWLMFGLITAGPQFLGHTTFNYLLEHVRASVVAIALLAEPVGATILAYLILGEVPGLCDGARRRDRARRGLRGDPCRGGRPCRRCCRRWSSLAVDGSDDPAVRDPRRLRGGRTRGAGAGGLRLLRGRRGRRAHTGREPPSVRPVGVASARASWRRRSGPVDDSPRRGAAVPRDGRAVGVRADGPSGRRGGPSAGGRRRRRAHGASPRPSYDLLEEVAACGRRIRLVAAVSRDRSRVQRRHARPRASRRATARSSGRSTCPRFGLRHRDTRQGFEMPLGLRGDEYEFEPEHLVGRPGMAPRARARPADSPQGNPDARGRRARRWNTAPTASSSRTTAGGSWMRRRRRSTRCPEVVEAVRGRVPVLVDGGVRRGTDVVTALALGAAAVLIARPVSWGLATGGEAGASRPCCGCSAHETENTMTLCGCRSVAEISRDLVRPAG